MSIAVPVTTLAGHIAALQHAGAVAVWPMDDPVVADGQRLQELSGQSVLMSRGGQTGLPGPYGEPTAWGPSPTAIALGNPYAALSQGFEWPPSLGQPAMTWCAWVFYPQGDAPWPWFQIQMGWAGGPVTWWTIWWAGWHATFTGGGGVAWPTSSTFLSLPWQTVRQLEGRWTHITVVLDTTTRLYWDGELLAQGGLPAPAPVAGVRPDWLRTEVLGPMRLQAWAFFDRALTAQEVASLHLEAPAPPAAAGVKVWDGSQWVEGTAKGWDGSQWRQAKIWTGEDWR